MEMKIVCERCHQTEAKEYSESYHFKKYQEDTRHYPICTTCHDPHFKAKKTAMSQIEYKQEIVDICSKCHQKDIETYVHSRHFHELEGGNAKAPVCISCHEKHSIKKPSDPNAKVSPANISDVCNECHPGHKESLHSRDRATPGAVSCATCHTGHQTDMASINQAIFKEGGIFNRCNYCHTAERHAKESLAHGEIMLLDKKGQPANCTQCHIYHAKLPMVNGGPKNSETQECKNCHPQQYREYTKSIHGRARSAGIKEAPTCSNCHGEVNIKKVEEQFSPERLVQICSSCHADKNLMLKLQINPYVTEGYKDTYHGKIMEMGSKNLKFAVCSNCHGSHSILPPNDPQSSVSRAHIVETCKQCHPRANDKFVTYLAHPKKPTDAELKYGRELASNDESAYKGLRLRGLEAQDLVRYTKIN
jgi:predicted CXXCH cytochrome family protein